MLQSSTVEFLQQLAQNNNREWFNTYKQDYKAARKDFNTLVGKILTQFGKIEPDVQGLQPKNCVFRIYRDVRFSKNKLPYKTNFGAAMGKDGRKSPFPSYYLHVEPGGNSFIGGGLYRPSGAVLKAVRQEIDYNLEGFEEILNAHDFKKEFGTLRGEQLKTKPKGYGSENPAIKYLRFKDFVVMHPVSDEQLTRQDLEKYVVEKFKCMKNFIDFLKMPIFDVV